VQLPISQAVANCQNFVNAGKTLKLT